MRRIVNFLLALLVAFGTPMFPAANRDRNGPTVTLRADSSLVLVPAHITNRTGDPVTDLGRENFRVFENGAPQEITYFAKDDRPVSVGLLWDISGSMKNKIRRSGEAARTFFRLSNPEDEFFLVEFGDRAKMVVPFTRDESEISSRIVQTRPAGRTSLLDAIQIAAAAMKKSSYTRKALLVLSDGGDNCSRHTVKEIRRLIAESDILLYAIGIVDSDFANHHPVEEKNGPALLEELASQSGGRFYPVTNLDDLAGASSQIAERLRTEYVLGYRPANTLRDGKYRKIHIELSLPVGSPVLFKEYRRGYYATN